MTRVRRDGRRRTQLKGARPSRDARGLSRERVKGRRAARPIRLNRRASRFDDRWRARADTGCGKTSPPPAVERAAIFASSLGACA